MLCSEPYKSALGQKTSDLFSFVENNFDVRPVYAHTISIGSFAFWWDKSFEGGPHPIRTAAWI